jgi:hydrogenase maturation protease
MSSAPFSAPPDVTVAGIGNWLIAADRVGPRVLELMRDRWGDAVELADIGSGGLSLLDHLRGQRLLVVVDACAGRGAPGEVVVVEGAPADVDAPVSSSHQIGPVEALIVARHLTPDALPRRIVMVLTETTDLDEIRLDEVCRRVAGTIDALVEGALAPDRHGAPERRLPCT